MSTSPIQTAEWKWFTCTDEFSMKLVSLSVCGTFRRPENGKTGRVMQLGKLRPTTEILVIFIAKVILPVLLAKETENKRERRTD